MGVGAIGDLVSGDVALCLQPVIGAYDLRGIRGGGEDLGDERVRVEGDGGGKLLKLLGGKGLRRGLGLVNLRRIGLGQIGGGLVNRRLVVLLIGRGILLWCVRLLRVLRLLVGVGVGLVLRLRVSRLRVLGLGVLIVLSGQRQRGE